MEGRRTDCVALVASRVALAYFAKSVDGKFDCALKGNPGSRKRHNRSTRSCAFGIATSQRVGGARACEVSKIRLVREKIACASLRVVGAVWGREDGVSTRAKDNPVRRPHTQRLA